ncbi:MAG: hypothetical protein V1722_00750 [Candidatus Micrarchaeota archaeon]
MWNLKNEIRKLSDTRAVVEETALTRLGDKRHTKRIVRFQVKGPVKQDLLRSAAVKHGFVLTPKPPGAGTIIALVEKREKGKTTPLVRVVFQHHENTAPGEKATHLTYFSIEHATGNVTSAQEERVLAFLKRVLPANKIKAD